MTSFSAVSGSNSDWKSDEADSESQTSDGPGGAAKDGGGTNDAFKQERT